MKSAEFTPKNIPKQPFKELPYFKEGILMFEDSGHKLTLSDRHYRCVLDCNKKCEQKSEKQINTANLRRNFANLSLKFAISEDVAEKLSRKFLKEVFYKLLDDALDDNPQEEIIETTLVASFQDITKSGKMKKGDMKTIENAFLQKQKNELSTLLIGGIGQAIGSFSHTQDNQGQFLSHMTKKIYLSDTGKVQKLEMEKLGWYILNYFDRYIPNYLYNLKKQGIEIVNGDSQINTMSVFEAAKYFKNNPEEEMLSSFQPTTLMEIIELFKQSLGLLTNIDPKSQSIQVWALYNVMNQNPAFQVMTPLAGLLKVKKTKGRKSLSPKP